MAVGRLAEARLAVLPFALVLCLYTWYAPAAAKRLTRKWPRWLKVPLFAVLFAGGLGGILTAQGNLYTKMTGIWALENDNYFFGLLLFEIAAALVLIFRLAYRERRRERSAATK